MLIPKKVLIVSSGLLTVEKPPAAIGFIAGVCRSNSIQYSIFDLNVFLKQHLGDTIWNHAYVFLPILTNPEHSDLLDKINTLIDMAVETMLADSTADLIAITLFSYQQILITQLLLQKIRSKSNIKIIIGGSGISYEIEENKTVGRLFLEQNLVDYYVLGEGEYVLDRFFKGHNELGLNSNLSVGESWAPQIDNLDKCVFPTYREINFSNYTPGININPTISITGSRGCVRRCSFCDVGHIWKKFRYRSAENIVQEIKQHFEETGIKQFVFTDSLINGSLKQFVDLNDKLIDLKAKTKQLEDLAFSGQFIIRPKSQHHEYLYQKMSAAGCNNIQIGIESGSNRVREHIGKKFSNQDIDYHLEMCSKYKIKNTLLMMTAYPTETLEDHNDNIQMFKRYQKYLLDDTVIGVTLAHPYVLLKNTPMDLMKHELGIHNENYATHFFDISSNPTLTLKERFRRYLELKILLLDLKYPGSWADLTSLEEEINNLKLNIKIG